MLVTVATALRLVVPLNPSCRGEFDLPIGALRGRREVLGALRFSNHSCGRPAGQRRYAACLML